MDKNVAVQLGFNPFAGFLGAATQFLARIGLGRRHVSIPSRVFWVLRHDHGYSRNRVLLFQSLRGFSGCCDSTSTIFMSLNRRFNPFAGFLGAATMPRRSRADGRRCFNPFAGFLGAATHSLGDFRRPVATVSIPSRVFWVLRRRHDRPQVRGPRVSIPSRVFWVLRPSSTTSSRSSSSRFQSLRGFSGCCDATMRSSRCRSSVFQSLRGFSGCCDPREQ